MPLFTRTPVNLADYQAIAALQALVSRAPASAEQLQAEDQQHAGARGYCRMVAVDQAGALVGTFAMRPASWISAVHAALELVVTPSARQQGIGAQLYTEACIFAQAAGATALITTLRDDAAPEARAFAERRGFALRQHWVYWALALRDFQEAPFLAVFERLQAQNIHFLTLAEAGNTPAAQRKLYELNRRTSLDAPGEDSFPSFDEFLNEIVHTDWFRPESQIIAADGDDWVGLGAVGIDGPRAFNAFAGVDRSHRRKGIALALTLLGIRYARQQGASTIDVFNDSRNQPMFNMQAQLGYQRIPGRLIMECQLA